jgi:hypothetical protein
MATRSSSAQLESARWNAPTNAGPVFGLATAEARSALKALASGKQRVRRGRHGSEHAFNVTQHRSRGDQGEDDTGSRLGVT